MVTGFFGRDVLDGAFPMGGLSVGRMCSGLVKARSEADEGPGSEARTGISELSSRSPEAD
jgi:hypothetical protein